MRCDILTVKDLMVPDTRRWDRMFIEVVLPQEMISKVLQILLMEGVDEDTIIWRLSMDGFFFFFFPVKSAYRLVMERYELKNSIR